MNIFSQFIFVNVLDKTFEMFNFNWNILCSNSKIWSWKNAVWVISTLEINIALINDFSHSDAFLFYYCSCISTLIALVVWMLTLTINTKQFQTDEAEELEIISFCYYFREVLVRYVGKVEISLCLRVCNCPSSVDFLVVLFFGCNLHCQPCSILTFSSFRRLTVLFSVRDGFQDYFIFSAFIVNKKYSFAKKISIFLEKIFSGFKNNFQY